MLLAVVFMLSGLKYNIQYTVLLAFLALVAIVRMKPQTLRMKHFEVYGFNHNVPIWFNRNLQLYDKVCT